MNKLETNALRIAELMGHNEWRLNNIQDVLISRYTAYDYLMPIVFECNRGDSAIKLKKHFVEFWYLGDNEVPHYNDYRSNHIITEPEFIEAIQECVIKYLELKNV